MRGEVVGEEEECVYPLGSPVPRKEFFMEVDVAFGVHTRLGLVGFEFNGAVDIFILERFVEVPAAPDHLTAPPSTVLPNGTPPHPTQPQGLTFPHGTQEGVGIKPATMPNAGQGFYDIRPLQDAPHLFTRKGQFICVYATQAQQITAKLAKTSNSQYMWSTRTHAKFNPHAMYYDAQHAPHYGKYLNDL